MKEPMPCKYVLPLLILFAVGVVLFRNGEFDVAMVLFGVAALVAVIIGESQFWVEKEPKKEVLYPEFNYKDYVTLCRINEREILSLDEWFKNVNLPISEEEI